MNDTFHTALKRLQLSGMAQTLDVRWPEAVGNGFNHTGFLELILQDELTIRAEQLMNCRVKGAAFLDPKTLEDFDFAFNPSIKRKQIFELATCKFVREARDVPLLGRPARVKVIWRKHWATRRSRRDTPCCTARPSWERLGTQTEAATLTGSDLRPPNVNQDSSSTSICRVCRSKRTARQR